MNQQTFTDMDKARDFLEIYRTERYNNQIAYYESRVREFSNAQRQAVWCSIGLVFLTALAGALEGIAQSWLKVVLLLLAAVCPILSTALAGYTALHGFTQQAKLYRDARKNLLRIEEPQILPDQPAEAAATQVSTYVKQVEDVLQTEHGFWGQLAEGMTPPGV